jgi:hypothetical protein
MDDSISSLLFTVISLALVAAVMAGVWKVFVKAGKPGWGCLVPIYNIILILEMAGKPMWWIVLLLIPLVSLIVAVLVNIEIAKKFGQSTGFGVGLALLPFIFYPMLGFGSARYQGGAAA